MTLAPDIREHAPRRGPQVGPDLGRGDVRTEAWERAEKRRRGDVLGVGGVAGPRVDISIEGSDMLLVDGLPVTRTLWGPDHA